MARFVAVPHEWTNLQAETYQREQGADGVVRGTPWFSPGATLPMVWHEDSVVAEPPTVAEEI